MKNSASDRGFVWIMCLLAREAEAEEAYSSIQRHWESLNDLTGDSILFVFAGTARENSHTDSCLQHGTESWRRLKNPSLHFACKDVLTVPGDRYPNFYDEITTNHTQSITELKNYFKLSESDIPSLVLTPTSQILRHSDQIVIKLNKSDLYGQVKEIVETIERPLRRYDIDRKSCERASKLLNERKEAVAKLSQRPKAQKRFLEARNFLEARVNEASDETLKATLLHSMKNGSFGNWESLDHETRGRLNQYIDLLRVNPEIEADINSRQTQLLDSQNQLKQAELDYGQKVSAARKSYLLLENALHELSLSSPSKKLADHNQEKPCSINIFGGTQQINTPSGGSFVYSPQNNGLDTQQLEMLIGAIRKTVPPDTSLEQLKAIETQLEIIKNELVGMKPEKGKLKSALKGLNVAKETAEFSAAVIALVQFVAPFL